VIAAWWWTPSLGGDVHWAAIVTSAAAIGAAIGVVFAAYQVNEARRSRHAATAADFSRRWDETDMIRSRQLARKSKTPDELRRQFMKAWTDLSTDDYLCLQIVPNYLEDLAILLKQGAINAEFSATCFAIPGSAGSQPQRLGPARRSERPGRTFRKPVKPPA
jgi:hypothetical protein